MRYSERPSSIGFSYSAGLRPTGRIAGTSRLNYLVLFVASVVSLTTPAAPEYPLLFGTLVAFAFLCAVLRRAAILVFGALIGAFVLGGPPAFAAVQLGAGLLAVMITWGAIRMAESWLWKFGLAAAGLAIVGWIL